VIVVQRFQGASFAAMAWFYFPERLLQAPGVRLQQVQGLNFARMSVSYQTPFVHKSVEEDPVGISSLSRFFTPHVDSITDQHDPEEHLAPYLTYAFELPKVWFEVKSKKMQNFHGQSSTSLSCAANRQVSRY
jgi:hypothetical protein